MSPVKANARLRANCYNQKLVFESKYFDCVVPVKIMLAKNQSKNKVFVCDLAHYSHVKGAFFGVF